jgi:hypothetical protein
MKDNERQNKYKPVIKTVDASRDESCQYRWGIFNEKVREEIDCRIERGSKLTRDIIEIQAIINESKNLIVVIVSQIIIVVFTEIY